MDLWGAVKKSVAAASNAAQSMMGLKQPHEEFQHLANATIAWIDKEAALPLSDGEPGLNAMKRSKVKDHVARIVELLVADAQQVRKTSALLSMSSPRSAKSAESESSAGLVIDALLQTRFVEQLCHRAIRDRPVGAMAVLVQCVASIIEEVQYPLLPHISIRNTLANLLPEAVAYSEECKSQLPPQIFEQTHKRVRRSLVLLLRAMWLRIADDRNQIDFFFQPTGDLAVEGDPSVVKRLFAPENSNTADDGDTEAETEADEHSQSQDDSETPPAGPLRSKPNLRIQPPGVADARIDILTPLVDVALQESELGDLAREALLVAVSLKETIVCDFLVTRTNLIPDLADTMAAAYHALPRTLDSQKVKPKGLLSTLVKFANVMTLLASEVTVVERTASPRRLPVRGEVDGQNFASVVVSTVLDRFVTPVLVPALTEPSEEQSLTACRYMSVILQSMAGAGRNAPLLQAFTRVVLSDSSPDVRTKMVGSMNSPSARIAAEACGLLARAISLASTDTVVEAMLAVDERDAEGEVKGDGNSDNDDVSRVPPDLVALANQELFQLKFDGVEFGSRRAFELENVAIRAIVRQCAVHASRPRIHAQLPHHFKPSSLLNALVARSKAFANIGAEAQNALVALFSSSLAHICAAKILPAASTYELRASDALLEMVFGAAYNRQYPSDGEKINASPIVDIAAKVWQDIFTHVTNIADWEEKLSLARQTWSAGRSTFDADTTIEPSAQIVLFTCCMLEEWILDLRAYLVACNMLHCEASLLGELHDQQDYWCSAAARSRVESGISIDDTLDDDSAVNSDRSHLQVDPDFQLDVSEEALDAEVSKFFITLDELARENPVSS